MNNPASIAHYRITSKLGEGGMGAVYRATDSKLDREVAIKILPERLAQDPDRLARFEREAKVLASLNHPHIAQIYGVEERALIMELVPGSILRGPLPLATAVNYAWQIAEALEAAHEKGIIHRDLKPANVMVTPEGVVKVLDFGLAAVQHTPTSDPENSPTLTMGATQAGVIMGTAAYMSPEQASGKPVDKRADIWSFGVVLFEMLTGRRLFDAGTVAHTLAHVLTAAIDLKILPETTPLAIRDLLRRCLNRDLKMRLHDIGDARVALQEYLANPVDEAITAPAGRRTGWIVSAALALIAAVAGMGWWKATPPVERPLMQFDADLGSEYSGGDVTISPDGARLVFVSKARLFTRRLNQAKATELAGTEGANGPFFSPDGQWVAFFSGGMLKKIPVEGGAAVTLCDAPSGRGGAWGEDHTIIATLTAASHTALSRIPDGGGAPQPLTELAQGELTHRWPQILPGGKAVLFTSSTLPGGFDGANIEVISLHDHRRKTLQRGGTYGRYLPASNGDGYLVYVNRGTLFAVPFDPDALEVRGTPLPVVQEVSYSSNSGSAQFDFSQDGTLVYRSRGMVTLQWLDGGGQLQALPAKPGGYGQPQLSPDGNLVALTIPGSRGSDIWTYDWQRDAMSKLTFGDETFAFPTWSPDGRFIAFRGDSGIFWTRADGAGKPQALTQSKAAQWLWSFSPDGKRLAYADYGSGSGDLWTIPLENDGGGPRAGKAEVFLQTPATNLAPAFSPDGRWIAYGSFEAGASEIYVRAFPDNGRKWQISNNGAAFAVWSRNGRDLFYRTPEQQIMVVSYTAKGDTFVPEKPRLWTSTRLANTGFHRNLDIHPDGKRFLVLMPATAQSSDNHVIFLLNFSGELRRRTAGGK